MSDEAADIIRELISQAYHNPKLRQFFGQEKLDRALADPAWAWQELVTLSATNQIPSHISREIDLAQEALGYYREWNGGSWGSPPAPASVPSGAALASAIAKLRTKSVDGTLTAAEERRYDQLLERRLEHEDRATAAAWAASSRPQALSRKQQLLRLSAENRLSVAEERELNHLYSQEFPEESTDGVDISGLLPVDDGASDE